MTIGASVSDLTAREKATGILSGAKLRMLEDAGLMVTDTPPMPTERYPVIMCDPPWSYRDKAADGERGVGFKYPVMTLDDIKGLPMRSISSKDCVLFLWATFPMMKEAFEVLSTWGFSYRTVAFTWVKTTKRGKLPWAWEIGRERTQSRVYWRREANRNVSQPQYIPSS